MGSPLQANLLGRNTRKVVVKHRNMLVGAAPCGRPLTQRFPHTYRVTNPPQNCNLKYTVLKRRKGSISPPMGGKRYRNGMYDGLSLAITSLHRPVQVALDETLHALAGDREQGAELFQLGGGEGGQHPILHVVIGVGLLAHAEADAGELIRAQLVDDAPQASLASVGISRISLCPCSATAFARARPRPSSSPSLRTPVSPMRQPRRFVRPPSSSAPRRRTASV